MTERIYWAVKDRFRHGVVIHTIREGRNASIKAFTKNFVIEDWKHWYRNGWRCVKVKVIEAWRDGR